MSEADRIDMDVSVEDLASVREHISLCSRAFSTATQKIEEYSKILKMRISRKPEFPLDKQVNLRYNITAIKYSEV